MGKGRKAEPPRTAHDEPQSAFWGEVNAAAGTTWETATERSGRRRRMHVARGVAYEAMAAQDDAATFTGRIKGQLADRDAEYWDLVRLARARMARW